MIYRSNLRCPDLSLRFAHLHLTRGAFHHDYPSDWADKAPDDPFFAIYRKCGFWTHDEAAILYNVACGRPGEWLDIGAHTGWTSLHLAASGSHVSALEPLLTDERVLDRFLSNIGDEYSMRLLPMLSADYRQMKDDRRYRGVVIDADHCSPHPLEDAKGAHTRLQRGGVILFHDAIGGPVWEGIYWLLDQGYKCKMYLTPQMVACCYRDDLDDWEPPEHVPDPIMYQVRTNHMKDFDWSRVE